MCFSGLWAASGIGDRMPIFLRVLAIVLVLVIGGGLAFLVTWDIPPPEGPIVKPIDDAKLPK